MPAKRRSLTPTTKSRSKSPATTRDLRSKSPTPRKAGKVTEVYRDIFNQIDVNGSNLIDAGELLIAMKKAFPDIPITPATINLMIKEADINNDGEISYEEFATIMMKAEVKSELWQRAQTSLMDRLRASTTEMNDAIKMISQPLRNAAQSSCYEDRHGKFKVASVGIRLVTPYVVWIILSSISYPIIYIYPEFTKISAGFFFLLNCVLHCFGKDIALYLFGMTAVNKDTGKPLGLIHMFAFQIIFNLLCVLEFFMLLCTGRSVAERLFGAVIIVD